MGIISIKSTDNLFWLGRYVERVFTTLRVFSEYYDKMIDKDENAYIDFCNKLGIENTYSYKQEWMDHITSGEYEKYYESMYKNR